MNFHNFEHFAFVFPYILRRGVNELMGSDADHVDGDGYMSLEFDLGWHLM